MRTKTIDKANPNTGMRIEFPPLGLILLMLPICIIFKLCGGFGCSWLVTTLIMPIVLYVVWCAALLSLALMCMLIVKALSPKEKGKKDGK